MLRHRARPGGADPGRRAGGLRSAAGRDHQGPGPAPAHLRADRGVRAFRPGGARLLLGAGRPHDRAAASGRPLTGRPTALARPGPPAAHRQAARPDMPAGDRLATVSLMPGITPVAIVASCPPWPPLTDGSGRTGAW